MRREAFDNNKIHLTGVVANDPKFSHEVPNEKIYEFEIKCKRASEYVDTLKCLIPEVFISNVKEGKTIKLEGEIRTRNIEEDNKSKLKISVFVINEPTISEDEKHSNLVSIKGVLCKDTIFRETPLGREIADLLLAVNRPYGKADYIPCVIWGRNAIMAKQYKVGTKVELSGRLQSREYNKMIDDKCEKKVAYEMSASIIKVVEE